MRWLKIILLSVTIFMNIFILTGCWNYKEVDKFAIVAGLAIDKASDNLLRLTIEIPKVSGGMEPTMTSKTIETEGETIFEAVRNGISISGRRLYWGHAKIIIISKEIAKEGITDVVDWYARDAEARTDIQVLISDEDKAAEILSGELVTADLVSYELEEMMLNQKYISEFPITEIWDLSNILKAKGIECAVPVVRLIEKQEKKVPFVMGSAVFKSDKLVGFLNGDETKSMLFIKDKIEGGLLTVTEGVEVPVTLEIFKSKTKIKPYFSGENIEMDIDVSTDVAIEEIDGPVNYIDDGGHKKLKHVAEELLKTRIETVIKKVQTEYGTDVFGFGQKIRQNKPKEWTKLKDNWDEEFKNLKVNVKTNVKIKNSAELSNHIEVGD